jgi:capsular polysaccharide biosynthesis protein
MNTVVDNFFSEELYINDSKIFTYYNEPHVLYCSSEGPIEFTVSKNVSDKEFLDLTENGTESFVVYASNEYYHFIIDTLSPILSQYKKNKQIRIILFSRDKTVFNDSYYSFLKFLIKSLEMHGISYKVVDISESPSIKLNNFIVFKGLGKTHNNITKNILEYVREYLHQTNIEPTKKIYLSRSKVNDHDLNTLLNGRNPGSVIFNNDKRVDDEDAIEKFFVSNGFEVVNPEELKSFEDQIKLISSAKVLASLTGAGLTNMVFMHPGQKVIELTTPLLSSGAISFHQHYWSLAYVSQHIYQSVPNNRKAKDLIVYLEKKMID